MDESALPGELERMHPASFGWALWCCNHRREEAEEVLQTTYLKILEGTARFDGKSSLRTWLFAVIRRTAMERRRRQWLRGQIFDRWQASQPEAPFPPDPETVATLRAQFPNLSESEFAQAVVRIGFAMKGAKTGLEHDLQELDRIGRTYNLQVPLPSLWGEMRKCH